MVARLGGGPCTALCANGRKNCAAGCCACVDDNYTGHIYTGPGGPGGPGPIIGSPSATFTQNVLMGVTFPSFSVSGLNNVTNGVKLPTLPSVTGVSVDSLKQNVIVPSVPVTTPATKDSSLNWLWVLVIIPIVIAGVVAMSKSKSKSN
jgi:hypothetical protein